MSREGKGGGGFSPLGRDSSLKRKGGWGGDKKPSRGGERERGRKTVERFVSIRERVPAKRRDSFTGCGEKVIQGTKGGKERGSEYSGEPGGE